MDLKQKLFVFFLIFIIVFPFFFSKKNLSITKQISLPNITIKNGEFVSYDPNLTKKGDFKYLSYFNDNNYIFDKAYVFLVDKNSSLNSKKIKYHNNYYLYDSIYKTPEYTYISPYAIYNDKTKILTAYKLKFFNKKVRGFATKMIDKNDILIAQNVDYIIKDKK